MSLINLQDISVSYDGKVDILKKLNLQVEEGSLVSLLGPSGCGKTTTLRVIAGFVDANEGQFIFDEKDMTKLAVHKRNFGLVFQSYALFPHLTVFENVAFGLKMQKISKEEIKSRVMEMLETVDLGGFEKRYPKELSGGQRQRVALARALVIRPKLLLLDEPLSNLDAKLRINMRVEIRKIQQKLGITTIFVTHDQEECFSISDKVAVMNKGIIEQYDTPENIFSYPKSEFVARFVGFENFIDLHSIENSKFQLNNGEIFYSTQQHNGEQKHVIGTIRPDDIEIIDEEVVRDNCIMGTVEVRTYLGKDYQYRVNTEVGTIVVNCTKDFKYDNNQKIKIYLPPEKLILV